MIEEGKATPALTLEDDSGARNRRQASDPALESRTRSLLKGITWRILATLTTIAIAWLITGDVSAALQIGFIEVFAKIAIYYLHERAWAHVKMGASRA